MTRGLRAYAATAFGARAATETVGPGLVLVVAASGASLERGPWLLAALTGVAALAGPPMGVLLDRARRPARVFAATMLLLAGALALLAFLVPHRPELPLWVLLVVAAVGGIAEPPLTGAWSAQLPSFVPADRLSRAFAIDIGTYNLGGIVGPVLAGTAVLLGVAAPLLVPAALLLGALVMLRYVPIPVRAPDRVHQSVLADLRLGIGALLRRPALRRTTVITTLGLAGQAALIVAAPALSLQLTGGLTFVGLLLASFGAGGLIATLVLVRFPLRTNPDAVVLIAVVAGALAQTGLAFAPTRWLALAGAFGMGLADGPMATAMLSVRERESPPAAMAQVFTTGASLRTSAYAIATAALGTLAGQGFRTVLLWGTAVELAGVLAGWLVGRSRRPGRVTEVTPS